MDLAGLEKQAAAWLADDPDGDDRAELRKVLDGLPDTAAELADRFAGPLTFGTAGLRGPLRAGPHGMNRAVVRAAAAGVVGWLGSAGAAGPVVIGYDARYRSREFADETARVVTGAGREALVLPRPLPTPVLAFAVRRLDAVAGVMVTASHNPPRDNGYKVYLGAALGGDSGAGAQIVPPADTEIETAIRSVGPLSTVPLGPPGTVLSEAIVTSYVDSQAAPDPEFPTVTFPNPEEPGAMDRVVALADTVGADLVIANDPDADRCAVAVPERGRWRMLSGDEGGVLLADHLMRRGVPGRYATTIVSSSLLRVLCQVRGRPYGETLTGFKWIVRAGADLAFGYEEALGYCAAPHLVRDKDGISAALLICELAAGLRAELRTLADRLDELAAEFGVYATGQLSIRVEDLREITTMMARLRARPPRTLLDEPVTAVEDLLPSADVVTLPTAGARVVVRPSGTEPKLKAYLEVVEPPADDLPAARERAAACLVALRTEIATALGV